MLFKGDGFYITDNRSDSYRKKQKEAGGGDSGDSGTGTKAESSGGESKPAPSKKEGD